MRDLTVIGTFVELPALARFVRWWVAGHLPLAAYGGVVSVIVGVWFFAVFTVWGRR